MIPNTIIEQTQSNVISIVAAIIIAFTFLALVLITIKRIWQWGIDAIKGEKSKQDTHTRKKIKKIAQTMKNPRG